MSKIKNGDFRFIHTAGLTKKQIHLLQAMIETHFHKGMTLLEISYNYFEDFELVGNRGKCVVGRMLSSLIKKGLVVLRWDSVYKRRLYSIDWNIKGCHNCHYSENGKHSCNRLCDDASPKINKSLGFECYPERTHWLEFTGESRHRVGYEEKGPKYTLGGAWDDSPVLRDGVEMKSIEIIKILNDLDERGLL